MLNPLKRKYHRYYMAIAQLASYQSTATRHQVGAVVVTPSGMLSTGWNGMPAGLGNNCEDTVIFDIEIGEDRPKTNAEVIHAERNAIDKMTRQGVPTKGSILFVTRCPCFECAKALSGLDLAHIYYRELHDCDRGLALLSKMNIPTTRV